MKAAKGKNGRMETMGRKGIKDRKGRDGGREERE